MKGDIEKSCRLRIATYRDGVKRKGDKIGMDYNSYIVCMCIIMRWSRNRSASWAQISDLLIIITDTMGHYISTWCPLGEWVAVELHYKEHIGKGPL